MDCELTLQYKNVLCNSGKALLLNQLQTFDSSDVYFHVAGLLRAAVKFNTPND